MDKYYINLYDYSSMESMDGSISHEWLCNSLVEAIYKEQIHYHWAIAWRNYLVGVLNT